TIGSVAFGAEAGDRCRAFDRGGVVVLPRQHQHVLHEVVDLRVGETEFPVRGHFGITRIGTRAVLLHVVRAVAVADAIENRLHDLEHRLARRGFGTRDAPQPVVVGEVRNAVTAGEVGAVARGAVPAVRGFG